MKYRISKKYYFNLLNGIFEKHNGGWILKPLGSHENVVTYLRSESGLSNIVDVVYS